MKSENPNAFGAMLLSVVLFYYTSYMMLHPQARKLDPFRKCFVVVLLQRLHDCKQF